MRTKASIGFYKVSASATFNESVPVKSLKQGLSDGLFKEWVSTGQAKAEIIVKILIALPTVFHLHHSVLMFPIGRLRLLLSARYAR